MRAAVFPGQGNQYVGMGKDIYDSLASARQMYDLATKVSGIDIARISFEGPEAMQRATLNTQLITFVHSCVAFSALATDSKPQFSQFAGHSIGEYASLVAAGALSFEDGINIVRKRGELMQKISFDKPSLVAVLGVDRKELEDYCRNASEGDLEVALYNGPGNYVVGGLPEAIERHIQNIPGKVRKALRVSGPFHTSRYKSIADEFLQFLAGYIFNEHSVEVYSNVTACLHVKESVAVRLAEQLYSPVRWEDIIRSMNCEFFEIGPGDSLAKFGARILKGSVTHSVNDLSSLEAARALLRPGNP